MKSILAAAALLALGTVSAAAADMAARPYTKAAPLVDTWSWAGWYVGGNVGYGISRSNAINNLNLTAAPFTTVIGDSARLAATGVIGGGQVGYNWQFAPTWVFGLEADFQGSDQRGTNTLNLAGFGGAGSFAAVQSRLNWFGTARARVGWTATPSTLLYVTGGYAYGEVEVNANAFFPGGPNVSAASSRSTQSGYTVGGGIETRLWNSNWTAKAEYLYVDLGGSQGTLAAFTPAVGFSQATAVDFKDHIVRVGVNYKFGPSSY